MKFKITKAEYDALSDDFKSEYSPAGNDYILSLEGGPDAKAGEKFEKERDRRRAAEKRAQDAEAKITELEDQFSDTAAAINTATKRATDAETKLKAAEEKYVAYVTKAEVDAAANKLAANLAPNAAKVLFPHVRARLALDMADTNAPRVVVLGDDGKPSDKKLEDLEKEFRDNKDFAGIIVTSRASGGNASRGAPIAPGNGFPAGGAGVSSPKSLADMRPSELAASLEAKVEARRRA